MTAVTIGSDFGVQENKVCHCFHFLPFYLPWSDAMIFIFECWVLSQPFHSRLSPSSRSSFSSSLLSAIRVVSSAYLKLFIFLPAVLIPAWATSSLEFRMMCSAYKLNKQGDSIQPWCIPFPVWTSLLFCLVLTVASWPAYTFFRRQVRWSGSPISGRIFHNLLWSTQSKALA